MIIRARVPARPTRLSVPARRWLRLRCHARTLLVAAVLVALFGVLPSVTRAAFTITQFAVRLPSPGLVAAGPDGNLWAAGQDHLVRITPAGRIVTLDSPNAGMIESITAGPDGNMWALESGQGYSYVDRITTAGASTGWSLRYTGLGSIARGSDGNLWFTGSRGFEQFIARITPRGHLTFFQRPATDVIATALGADGNVWFTQNVFGDQIAPVGGSQIGWIDSRGAVSLFPGPPALEIARGLGTDMWVTTFGAVVRISRTGRLTSFRLSDPKRRDATAIALGPDGNEWFIDGTTDQLGDRFNNEVGIVTPAGKCQWPSVSPQVRPSVLPTGGHLFSPLVAMSSPHDLGGSDRRGGAEPVGRGVAAMVALSRSQARGCTPLPAVAWASR